MLTLIKQLRRDHRGAAAVEMALVAPLIALVILGIADAADFAFLMHDMRGAVSSGAQYALGGSMDTDSVRAVALSGWRDKPPGGDVTVVKACRCGASAGTCGVLCADKTMSKTYLTIKAAATFSDAFINKSVTAQQVVRVR